MPKFCVHGGSHDGETIEISDDFTSPLIWMPVKEKRRVIPPSLWPSSPPDLGPIRKERYRIDRIDCNGGDVYLDD